MKRLHSISGFSLVELTVILVAVAIAMAVVMQSMTSVIQDTRRAETEREMEKLSDAIVGNPEQTANGTRSDFGYVGDVGIFPANLNALRTNVGSMPTWNGPYLLTEYTQDTLSYLLDGWGKAYSYSGGTTITSTGSGSTISKKLTAATTDYTRNTVTGTVTDNVGTEPGAVKKDSVRILIDMPAGASGTVTKQYIPNSSGDFTLDSIPAGLRKIRAVYLPENDTVEQYYTVLPHHRNLPGVTFRFGAPHFTVDTGGGGGGCIGGSLVLRPNGNGEETEFNNENGCSSEWQCVDEVSADDNSTYVYTNEENWEEEYFELTDSTIPGCSITSVVVTCRARQTDGDGDIRVCVFVDDDDDYKSTSYLTSSYANYSSTWTTNPATGVAWTWTDIVNLQAGCMARNDDEDDGYVRLTQVYVTVNYGP